MRLASFNIRGGRSDDGRTDPGRLSAAIVRLDADVVALQEVDRGRARSGYVDQTALAAAAIGVDGPAHVRFESTLESYGIALVSRRRVRAWRRIPLPRLPVGVPWPVPGPSPLWGRRLHRVHDEPRVALAAVLADPAPVRTVVTTHLSFLPGVNALQLRRLARAVRDLPGPLLLVGDLNLPTVAPPAVLRRWHGLDSPPTFPAADPRVGFDQALWRERVPHPGSARAVLTAVSDHRALVVDLARSAQPHR